MLGKQIKRYRELNGYTQYDLAKMLNRTIGAVSNWENDKNDISSDELLKLCEIFHVTPNELLAYDKPGRILDLRNAFDTWLSSFSEDDCSHIRMNKWTKYLLIIITAYTGSKYDDFKILPWDNIPVSEDVGMPDFCIYAEKQ